MTPAEIFQRIRLLAAEIALLERKLPPATRDKWCDVVGETLFAQMPGEAVYESADWFVREDEK